MIVEPQIVAPEKLFEAEIVGVIHGLLGDPPCRYLVVPRFGVDIAVFLDDGRGVRTRFIEAKCYAAGRPGGVGFGNSHGEGPQVDLLLCPKADIPVLDGAIRWVLVDATRPHGSARYAFFDCSAAQAAAMGGVAKGKQNNLRLGAFSSKLITWETLTAELKVFLRTP